MSRWKVKTGTGTLNGFETEKAVHQGSVGMWEERRLRELFYDYGLMITEENKEQLHRYHIVALIQRQVKMDVRGLIGQDLEQEPINYNTNT